MKNDIDALVREIKGAFRLEMNGVASQSMREKGAGYRLNWGIAYPTLKQMAKTYAAEIDSSATRDCNKAEIDSGTTRDCSKITDAAIEDGKAQAIDRRRRLAQALWGEDVRECRILATLLMPAEAMTMALAELLAREWRLLETAAMAAANLFWRIGCAKVLALKWIATSDELMQICGYHTLSRLFAAGGRVLDEREAAEFCDQAECAVAEQSLTLKHAASNALVRFEDWQDEQQEITASNN